jgi:hypothetical protein
MRRLTPEKAQVLSAMIITESAVQLGSEYKFVEQNREKSSLRYWVGSRRPDFSAAASRPTQWLSPDTLALSEQGKALANTAQNGNKSCQTCVDKTADADSSLPPRLRVLKHILERLTGQKIRLLTSRDLGQSEVKAPQAKSANASASQSAGWGLEYDHDATHYESEQTQFQAQGVVKTADGAEIKFNLDLTLSREFYQETHISLREGDAVKDPLVINFDGSAAELSNLQFDFDLDNDGSQETISSLAPNSGFLALDRNGDGVINNGSELFGPASGDGFGELAALDSDGNHWLDEADAAYSDLRVWSKDAGGGDILTTLAESGVGAIYLGRVETPFSLKDASNQTLGQVRSSGIYLTEAGSAGTVQQVDLAVAEKAAAA